MDLAATWDAEAYSNDLSEFDVFRFSETAGPSFEEPEVFTIEDDDELDAPIVIADGADQVNGEVETSQAQTSPVDPCADASSTLQDVQSSSNIPANQASAHNQTAAPIAIAAATQSAPIGQASHMQEPPSNSRLLSLPPEVRNLIWTYTVTDDNKVIHLSRPEWYKDEIGFRLNITLTNHQIRQESLLMFYASNTFLTRAKPYPSKVPLKGLSKWLGGLKEEYRAMLGRVVVCAKTSTDESTKYDWGKEEQYGFEVQGTVDVGGDQGHHCRDQHYLLARESGAEGNEEDAAEDAEGEDEAAGDE